jgi:7-cyano-7-deazaguanine synthase in queuosine biosynthesis
MKRYYALFSGGVDSVLAVLKVATQERDITVVPLFFDYGQKAAVKEEEAVGRLIPLLRDFGKQRNVVIKDYRKYELGGTDLFKWSESSILQGREDVGDVNLENRNMILISIAVSIIMSDRKREKTDSEKQGLIVGFKNEYYDTTRGFALGLNQVLGQKDISVEIVTPLVEDDNVVGWHSLAKQIHSIKGAEVLLPNTWSCYYPTSEGSPCTRCHPCISRGKLSKEVETRARMKSQEEQTA